MRNLVNLVVIAMIVLVGSGLIIAGVLNVRAAAARIGCANNMHQIGMSLHDYRSANEHFPQAGKPNPTLPAERRLSWLVEFAPYVEATDLYVRMDRKKGWDAEENRYLALTTLGYLQCPSFPDVPPQSTLVPTYYVGVAGLGVDAAELPLEDSRAGFFGYDRTLRLSDVQQGAGNLMAAVETTQTRGAWTAAGPPTARGLEEDGPPYLGPNGQFGGTHPGGANAVFADASVRFLRRPIDAKVMEAMATVRGSEE